MTSEASEAVTWPESPGWYWAFGRLESFSEITILPAQATLVGGDIVVYVFGSGLMSERITSPNSQLPMLFKKAAIPEFSLSEMPVPPDPALLVDDDGEVHESAESAEDFNRILRISKKLPEYVWSLAPEIDFDKIVRRAPHPGYSDLELLYVVAVRLSVDWIDGPISATYSRAVYGEMKDHARRSWADDFPEQSKEHALEILNRLIDLGLDIDLTSLKDTTVPELFDPDKDIKLPLV